MSNGAAVPTYYDGISFWKYTYPYYSGHIKTRAEQMPSQVLYKSINHIGDFRLFGCTPPSYVSQLLISLTALDRYQIWRLYCPREVHHT